MLCMFLKDNGSFELPKLQGRWHDGTERRYIPRSNLILKEVLQREDSGDIELVCKATDGPEVVIGLVRFYNNDPSKKNLLYHWLKDQQGKIIEDIYNSKFDLIHT